MAATYKGRNIRPLRTLAIASDALWYFEVVVPEKDSSMVLDRSSTK